MPDRDGTDNFDSELFADDAIFVEPNLGQRPRLVISCWEDICRKMLGKDAINNEKIALEGVWDVQHIISGLEINVDKLTIRLPEAKQMDAYDVVNSPEFRPGNQIVMVKSVQRLRGLVNHWKSSCRFWHYMASPINALMSFADPTETWIRCDVGQVWLTFWNLMKMIRILSKEKETWKALFEGSSDQVISLPKCIGSPRGRGKVIWVTGDAVLGQVGGINWDANEYILESADEFLRERSI